MTDTKDTMIRNVPSETINCIDEYAKVVGKSRNELMVEVLTKYASTLDLAYDPDMVLAWIEADRFADLDPNSECPGCESREFIDAIWFGVTGALQLIGPFCSSCADSE